MYRCSRCMKSYSHRQSLWKHKQGCDRYTPTNSYNSNDSTVGEQRKFHEKSGAKRTANSEPLYEKKSKMQVLADAIINDTPVKKMDLSSKLPAADALRKSPPPVFQKLPSPPQEVVDDVFKVPRTRKDLIGGSDDDKKDTDDSSESCSDKESFSDSNDDDDGSDYDKNSNSSDDSSNDDAAGDGQESRSESDDNSSDGSTTEDKESTDAVVDDEEQPVTKYKFLPKTIKGLEKRFNERFVEFTRHGKHENRNELVALLDEMLRRDVIERK